ncbi:transglycosylase SLT domain-containing protein [Photorhabdus laumondii subsp. laumondii]|uniref:peptidoglycan lytic exotransglycosylase n=2 Tax=Photorhabdus laumondii subsp. laumondii TaxID=141679 RepID=Q7N3P4_PHOLL|nr:MULTISPECIES: transglycosylase SLT domain-containing protein [Photorhabdus]AWK42406.1 lytic transglycosylase [Photorhabdus laumondii subsp. laumondii]AXG43252.1 lytic transglycosylase [Photorhabdus laumondii subsp. laumondii]AXG47723.1 lytic transglycosylase [Photorhabdus laumondii subsp. laumondii]KTL63587.1 lytic transglycosylase [Photorhabdus laumondii subsp. laumondii]MCC8384474.1 transglycosylase SLT domain-containing protein [Photorhabdus laumondii]
MKLKLSFVALVVLLVGCAERNVQQTNVGKQSGQQRMLSNTANAARISSSFSPTPFDTFIQQASNRYGVDETLIRAIIQVESGFRPNAVSKSNAIGLMQIKASTAGRDVYRQKGRSGQPTTRELKDPKTNIDLGTAYISILKEQHLAGIDNPETLYYATIVAYVNGAGALLRTFNADRQLAVNKINRMTPDEFYQYVQDNHPAPQAPRYLWKVKKAYRSLVMVD